MVESCSWPAKKKSPKRASLIRPPGSKGAPAWRLGSYVRVRRGVTDPDFPGVPLVGWTGVITEVNEASQPNLFLVKWDDATLSQMSPLYQTLCETQGLKTAEMWVRPRIIEEADATSLVIRPRPLYIMPPEDGQIDAFARFWARPDQARCRPWR